MGIWLDDEFYEHPKLEAAGDDAGWLWVVGLAYAGRNKTGGHIPATKAHRLTQRASKRLAERLVAVRLWERTETGYYIHDFPEYQQAAERRREEEAEKKRRRSEHARKAALARYGHDVSTDRAPPEQDVGMGASNERAGGEQCPSHARADTRPNHLPSSSKSSSKPLVGGHAAAEEEAPDDRITKALAVAVDHRLEHRRGDPVTNVEAWRAATTRRLRDEYGELLAALAEDQAVTLDELVALMVAPANGAHADDAAVAAQWERAKRNGALPACDECDSTGWVEREGVAAPCDAEGCRWSARASA